MAAEKLGQKPGPKRSFEEMFEHASAFLSSASNIWKNPSAAAKKIVLKLAFTERLEYTRESGFRTPKATLPFKALRDFLSSESRMADREGFEPSIRFPVYTRSRRAPSTTRPPVRPQRACRLEWAEYTQMDAECKDRRQIFSSFSGRCCFGAAKGRGMPQKVAESCGLLKVFRRGAEPSGPGKTLPWQLHLLCGMVFCSKI